MGGRGRGMAAFTFRVENLGITRNNMPEARRGPNALFPTLECKPVPLEQDPLDDYLRSLKQEFRGNMRKKPTYLKSDDRKSDVEKYKDMYLKEAQKIDDENWTPDWQRLPKELMPRKNVPKKKSVTKKKSKALTTMDKADVLSKLSKLEKTDNVHADDEKEEEEKKKGEEEEDEDQEDVEEEYEDEEAEEENDYIASYFDNGDDFEAGSDDNMDEATY